MAVFNIYKMSANFRRTLQPSKNLKSTLLFVLLVLLPFSSLFAQESKEVKTDVAFLKKNASDLAKSMKKDRQRAFDMAKKKGWPTFQITRQGKIIQLVGIDESGLPLYEATDNETAAGTTRANKLYTGGGLGLNLNGSTIPNNSVAVWESGGIILPSHQEFAGGRIQVGDGSVATTSHATHVGGTIAASGVYAPARGMAYGLPNLLSFDTDNDNAEMSAAAANLLLSNHSYGVVAGWTRNEDQNNRWEFKGKWGENEDYKFGYYDSKAQNWDNLCFNAPYYLPVKSAGNYRSVNGPAVGETYYRYNANGTMINAGARPAGISSNDGYGIVANYGTAKNILTVGAVNGLKYGSSSPSDIVFSSFTAWGPTDDGRIKPDLVADGVGVMSTNNTGNANYYVSGGTSMSTPNATGTLVLLQELYKQQNNVFMRSATLKGLAIATTSEAGPNLGPDYQFGWGLLNAENAAKAILDNGVKSIISERMLAQGETQTINVVASGNGPLVATICWTDPAAIPISSSLSAALNNPTLRLVNDLDMRINNDDIIYYPWILDPANPSFAAIKGDNFRDNVEQIYIANAIPGKSYTITITHKNALQGGSQAYSLIATGVGGSTYCTSVPTSNADSRITNFQMSNINHTPVATCTTYSDFTSQTVVLEKRKSYPLNLTLGTCGVNQNKIAKVFIDWNSDGDFDDNGELVATSSLIAANGSFNQNITVPANLIAGNYSRIRVVLVETSSANDVTSCGSYGKGETQDYRVLFDEEAVNVGVAEIVSPVIEDPAGANKKIYIKIKNFGKNAVSAVPVNVVVKDGVTTIATINEIYYGTIPVSGEVTFLLQGSFAVQTGKAYIIEARTNLATDFVAENDLATKTVSFSNEPSISDVKAYFTDVAGTNYLTSKQNNGTLFWYGASGSSTSLGRGNGLVTNTSPANGSTCYIGLNEYVGSMGPATKAAFGSMGSYGQASFRLYFDTDKPMEIESARLYIGYPGAVTFNVYDVNTGVRVSTTTISVNNTRTMADPSTSASNDAADAGKVYYVDVKFPYAGSFYLTADFDAATLFRNNSTNSSFIYPMTENTGSISLVSHTGQSGTAMQSFYYFFYNLKVKPIGEPVSTRVAVPLTNLQVVKDGNLLISPIEDGNQWYLNGAIINGATSSTYQPTQIGNYTVKVTLQGGVTITSQVYQLNALPIVLKDFAAIKQAEGVLLKWATLSEINNKEFLVESSVDGVFFTKLAQVPANANKYYNYLDKSPKLGVNYYRITQIDFDGKSEVFGPIPVNYDMSGNDLLLFENPVKTHFTVKATSMSAKNVFKIRISDVIGKKLLEIKASGTELINGYSINVEKFSAGTYVLEILDDKTGVKNGLIKFIKL